MAKVQGLPSRSRMSENRFQTIRARECVRCAEKGILEDGIPNAAWGKGSRLRESRF